MNSKVTKSPVIKISDDFPGYPLDSFYLSPNLAKHLTSVLIPGGLIRDRIERLAIDIASDYDKQSFVALCLLRGGYLFLNELIDKIKTFYRYRYANIPQSNEKDLAQLINVQFIQLKSYQDEKSTTNDKVMFSENLEYLREQNVLIVTDMIDTGNTMVKLLQHLKSYQMKSVRVVSLFVKRTPLGNGYISDYIGFDVPDQFIVGFNMDYNQYFGELNHICVLAQNQKQIFSENIKL